MEIYNLNRRTMTLIYNYPHFLLKFPKLYKKIMPQATIQYYISIKYELSRKKISNINSLTSSKIHNLSKPKTNKGEVTYAEDFQSVYFLYEPTFLLLKVN